MKETKSYKKKSNYVVIFINHQVHIETYAINKLEKAECNRMNMVIIVCKACNRSKYIAVLRYLCCCSLSSSAFVQDMARSWIMWNHAHSGSHRANVRSVIKSYNARERQKNRKAEQGKANDLSERKGAESKNILITLCNRRGWHLERNVWC